MPLITTSPAAMKAPGPTEVVNISNYRTPLSTVTNGTVITTPTSPSSPSRHAVAANGASSPQQQQPQLYDAVQPASAGAVGRTASSSKVIERLTADNDRLRRELRAERAAKEDAEEQLRTQKGLVSSLRAQASNLEHVHGSDRLLAERKDRRIAQLREQLEAEAGRRARAEDKAREACEELGETSAAAKRDVGEAVAAQKRAEAAYDTLRDAYRHLQDDIHGVRKRVGEVKEGNRVVDERIERITLISDERDKHQAVAQRTNAALRKRLDEYKARDERVARLENEMEEAVRAMRWVVKIHSPPPQQPPPPPQ